MTPAKIHAQIHAQQDHAARDHGGGLDAAIAKWGGIRAEWADLSTGINPIPYPVANIPENAWTALPDMAAANALEAAARDFWMVPKGAAVLAAPGASCLIANIPRLLPAAAVQIARKTYNEHEAAFRHAGWKITGENACARVIVHPNNPTGLMWSGQDETPNTCALLVIDESFCDIALGNTHIRELATQPGVIILKSLGKFWGLAGLRLGFAIGDPDMIARLQEMLGPWPVSGPALHVGRTALEDMRWANATRQRLAVDVARLDAAVLMKGAELIGGTALFRLYKVDNALKWQNKLAKNKVWSRVFPYDDTWLRLGLPPADKWDQVEGAL